MEKRVTAGIIAEYNPFHNGHAYQIEAARAAGATHIVAVMSGNFVQRGGPACAPKQLRANAALACGVDLVLELPLPYAMATAERFAFGAVRLLDALGCVDVLSFGCECGDLALLSKAADAVNSNYCHELTRQLLESGITYAAARQKAVARLYGPEVAALLEAPNDTLAIEYLRQLAACGYRMAPHAVQRQGAGHDDAAPTDKIASASYLRTLLELESVAALAPYLPEAAMKLYRSGANGGLLPFAPHSLNLSMLAALRHLPQEAFAALPDLSEGLENRLYEAARQAVSLDGLLSLVKTKRYPLARIRRLLWSAFLSIPADLQHTPPPYARVLAFNQRGLALLSTAKAVARLPISTSLKKLEEIDERCARFALLEAGATDLFVLGLPSIQPCGSDYTARISVCGNQSTSL